MTGPHQRLSARREWSRRAAAGIGGGQTSFEKKAISHKKAQETHDLFLCILWLFAAVLISRRSSKPGNLRCSCFCPSYPAEAP